jgi:hypothetical protein
VNRKAAWKASSSALSIIPEAPFRYHGIRVVPQYMKEPRPRTSAGPPTACGFPGIHVKSLFPSRSTLAPSVNKPKFRFMKFK